MTTAPPKRIPTGARLRQLAFAYLGRREYSKQMLIDKLSETGADPNEIQTLVAELADSCYQSDARMASMTVRANLRRGRGLARIRQDLKKYAIDPILAEPELAETDWLQHAIALRNKKFGSVLPTDPKEKARQFRFLQYRGFDLDVCRQAISHVPDDD
ncbi:MAG: regulatory protein RecX [Pseudomonadota bacterium]|nr:regulatory protein RecX [Pseudomonadota bacterium]